MALSDEEVGRIAEEEAVRWQVRRALEERAKLAGCGWDPGTAAFLSLIVPGLGQVYKGWAGSGVLWFLLVVGGYLALILPGLALHLCCVLSASFGRSKDEVRRDRAVGRHLSS